MIDRSHCPVREQIALLGHVLIADADKTAIAAYP
jgi:hypothetical protein